MKTKRSLFITAVLLALCMIIGTASVFANTDGAQEDGLTVSLTTEAAAPETVTVQEDEAVVIALTPQEGYILPEELILQINETQYTVRTDGQENPEGIAFDPETNELTISPLLVNDGDSIALYGAAQKTEDPDQQPEVPAEEPETPAEPEAPAAEPGASPEEPKDIAAEPEVPAEPETPAEPEIPVQQPETPTQQPETPAAEQPQQTAESAAE